jgi:hypothetical protein
VEYFLTPFFIALFITKFHHFYIMEKATPRTLRNATPSELSVSFRNEVRCCTKLVTMVFQQGQMSSREIDEKLDDFFHGRTEISHTHMIVKLVETVVSDQEENPFILVDDETTFVLDRDYLNGRHLTKPFFENNTMNVSGGLERGRTLQRIAKRSMAKIKKAFAILILMREVDDVPREDVTLKSGICEIEVKFNLLDLMFFEVNGKDDVVNLEEDEIPDDNALENDDTGANHKNTSTRLVFTGRFPFCLYGPFVNENLRNTISEKGGNIQDSSKVNGRVIKLE